MCVKILSSVLDVPPKVDDHVFEPEVHALIGDQAVLRCAVSGNPNPSITWSKDNTIVSKQML